MNVGSSKYGRQRTLILTGLLLFALGLRGFRAAQECIANPDILRFIGQAQGLAADPIRTLRTEPYHPLHAAAGLAVHAMIAPLIVEERWAWLWAMRVVGIVAASVVTVQIALLARALGARWWAAVGAAVLFTVGRRTSVYGADGLSDMLMLALFGAAMLVTLRAMRFRPGEASWRYGARFFVAGLLAGIAYLARPDALAVLVIVGGTLLIMMVWRTVPARRRTTERWFKVRPYHLPGMGMMGAALGCLAAGFLVPALPYMMVIGDITLKKPVLSAYPLGMPAGTSHEMTLSAAAAKITTELWETLGFGPWLVLLLALPLRWRLWGRPRVRMLVLVWLAVWLAVMVWLLRRPDAGYLSGRHTLPMIMLLMALVGLALDVWRGAMVRCIRWWRAGAPGQRWSGWPGVAAVVAFALAALPGIVELRQAPGRDKVQLRQAAEWVREHVKQEVIVCDRDGLVAYYSGHPYAQWHGTAEELAGLHHHDTAVIGRTTLLGAGEKPAESLGQWRAIAQFASPISNARAEHEVYVLYAPPGIEAATAR